MSQNLTLINYQNAQIIHIGIQDGKEVIKQEIDIDTEIETAEGKAEDLLLQIYSKLKNMKETIIIYKTNNWWRISIKNIKCIKRWIYLIYYLENGSLFSGSYFSTNSDIGNLLPPTIFISIFTFFSFTSIIL